MHETERPAKQAPTRMDRSNAMLWQPASALVDEGSGPFEVQQAHIPTTGRLASLRG